jgi:hypothetical protein
MIAYNTETYASQEEKADQQGSVLGDIEDLSECTPLLHHTFVGREGV